MLRKELDKGAQYQNFQCVVSEAGSSVWTATRGTGYVAKNKNFHALCRPHHKSTTTELRVTDPGHFEEICQKASDYSSGKKPRSLKMHNNVLEQVQQTNRDPGVCGNGARFSIMTSTKLIRTDRVSAFSHWTKKGYANCIILCG